MRAWCLGLILSLPILLHSPLHGEEPDCLPQWESVESALIRAELRDDADIRDCLIGLNQQFELWKDQCVLFADEAFSVTGKIAYATRGQEAYREWLEETFKGVVFSPPELSSSFQYVTWKALAGMEANDNRLWVEVCADLPDLVVDPALSFSRESLVALYPDVVDRVRKPVGTEVSRNLGSLLAAELAEVLLVRIGQSLAVRLGVTTGIYSAGAATSWASLGATIVLAIAIDWIIASIVNAVGGDPRRDVIRDLRMAIGQLQQETMRTLREALLETVKVRRALRREHLLQSMWSPSVQENVL